MPDHPADQPTPTGLRRWGHRRVAVVALAVVGAAVLAGGTALALVVRSLENNVARTEVFSRLDERDRPQAAQGPAEGLTVLVLGSDDREDDPIGREVADPAGGYHAGGKRADTTLLVRLPADRDGAWVVSVPRDLYVTLPACQGDDGEQLPERKGQFGLAFRDGGLTCTVRAVEELSDVRVDHTVVVDFTGFTDMVDALGGVPVCLDEPFRPREVALELPPGRHVLEARQALDFVRARYGVDDSTDLARIERQKTFMSSMVERARSRDLLMRPDRLLQFASAATSSLEVDQNLDVRDLALSLRGIEPADVLFTTVPLDPTPGPRFAEGGDLFGRVVLDEQAAADLFAAFERDQLPKPAPVDDAPAGPPAGEAPAGPPAPGDGAAPAPPPDDAPAPAGPPTRTAAESPCR